MIRSLALHDVPINSIAAMERWYHRDHAPEIVRRYGPWLARLEGYLPVCVPPENRDYGFHNWRLTEAWWREVPAAVDEANLCFTPPPIQARVAACFIPTQPTEVLVEGDFLPLDSAPLRWLVLVRYPRDVPLVEAEEWLLGVHGPELAERGRVLRATSYEVTREVDKVPGRWCADAVPPPDRVKTVWDRVVEMWFESFDEWDDTVKASYTRPPWATGECYPLADPSADVASTFILERPNDDYLRDLRGYVP